MHLVDFYTKINRVGEIKFCREFALEPCVPYAILYNTWTQHMYNICAYLHNDMLNSKGKRYSDANCVHLYPRGYVRRQLSLWDVSSRSSINAHILRITRTLIKPQNSRWTAWSWFGTESTIQDETEFISLLLVRELAHIYNVSREYPLLFRSASLYVYES